MGEEKSLGEVKAEIIEGVYMNYLGFILHISEEAGASKKDVMKTALGVAARLTQTHMGYQPGD